MAKRIRRPEVPVPRIEGPVSGGGGVAVLQGTLFNLAQVGYGEEEFFVSGTARAYRNVGAQGPEGFWNVRQASSADYRTRIVVRRPTDAGAFSGLVVVEWLNVSAGFDSAPDWIASHVELIRRGHGWVGVTAQRVGVEGGGVLPIPGLDLSLKHADPARYASLLHPGDDYSYDMFSQVGRLLHERGAIDPLGGLVPAYLVAIGESQSAWRMVTYVNAFAPWAGVYDGYLIHSRPGGATPLMGDPFEGPIDRLPERGVARIRTDLDIPVLTFQTETDLFELGALADRQDDSERFRWWEVAGTAHADTYTVLFGLTDVGGDPKVAGVTVTASPFPGLIECAEPINGGPQHHFVLQAGLRALERWVRDGVPAPSSPRLEVAGTPPAFVLDDRGNVRGGIRSPWVDVPIARLRGEGQGERMSFAYLFGKTIPFDDATLDALYPDHATYVSAVAAATQAAVEAGFLLSEDAGIIIAAAEAADIGRRGKGA